MSDEIKTIEASQMIIDNPLKVGKTVKLLIKIVSQFTFSFESFVKGRKRELSDS